MTDGLTELDLLIASKKERISKLRHDLDLAEAELRGIKIARDQLFFGASAKQQKSVGLLGAKVVEGAYRGGRQPGAISSSWRKILSDLYYIHAEWFSAEAVTEVAARHGISIKPKYVRDRMMDYIVHNYIEANPDIGNLWRVTKAAAMKFNFDNAPLKDGEQSDQRELYESPDEGDGPSIYS